MPRPSRSALDRLGERLRHADVPSEEDREAYNDYRASFAESWLSVIESCQDIAGSPERPGARLKTLESTIAKLRRGTFRLSQIQDIAGIRVVVTDLETQDRTAASLEQTFTVARTIDYRDRPQNGYRAVHRFVEIQVRTTGQDLWANLCEEAANLVDLGIKYGEGPEDILKILDDLSAEMHTLDVNVVLVDLARRVAASGYADNHVTAAFARYQQRPPQDADEAAAYLRSTLDDLVLHDGNLQHLLAELDRRVKLVMRYPVDEGTD